MTATAPGGTFRIGNDLLVHRMGFGAMQLTGPGVWGPPLDEANARAVLRRAVELGIDLIDTADVYGPEHNERVICEALNPYPSGLVIATKAGLIRKGSMTSSRPIREDGSAYHIRKAVETSLRVLGVDHIKLYQLHRVDPDVPIEETMEVFAKLREEGKIGHVGISSVTIEQIERARAIVEIATVQNRFNLAMAGEADVLDYCERNNIGFMPYFPLHIGKVAQSRAMARVTARTGGTPQQVALAWLLQRSPVMLLIPGTSSISHLEQNVAACQITMSDAEIKALALAATEQE